MSDDDLLDWLRLTRTPGLGPVGLRRLLQALGDPAAALRAPPRAWQPWTGPQAAAGHTDRQGADEQARRAFEATLSWQTEDPARRAVLAWGDPAYPALLLQTADPPPLLWLTGDSDWLSRPSVAIVGSRSATPQGLDNARAFARALSQAGLTVVSGLASGIDGPPTRAPWRGRPAPSPSPAADPIWSTRPATAAWRPASPRPARC